jgi:hypothetical protein
MIRSSVTEWGRWLGATCAVLLLGCSRVGVVTPKGFVELTDQEEYDYRATSADGLVIGVRELENEPRGELDFWSRAIENQLRRQGGYALLETRDVKSRDGIAGKQFRFGHDEERAPHLYYVAVFVTPGTIALFEVGGTKELVTQHGAELDAALANYSVD